MKKWVYCEEKSDRATLLRILKRMDFEVGTGCYMLSDPKYVFVDLEQKTARIGCRFPSSIKDEAKTDFFDFLKLIITN